MERPLVQDPMEHMDWREMLVAAFDLKHTSFFNFEWLADKAERGDWSGLWW